MPRFALRLHDHLGYHVRGVDLFSIIPGITAWRPSKIVKTICHLNDRLPSPVDRLWHENERERSDEKLCLRAWISAKVALHYRDWVQDAGKVDTCLISREILLCLSTLLRQTDILALAQPTVSDNEFQSFDVDRRGNVKLENARYKTRVRVNSQAYVRVTDNDGTIYKGRATSAHGRTTHITFKGRISDTSVVQSVRVIGPDDLTSSDKARNSLLLQVMRNEVKLLDADFVRFLWFPTNDDIQLLNKSSEDISGSISERYTTKLNRSQATVVAAMTSELPIVIVHGPPGTGKTTTISSAAEIWSNCSLDSVWIVGHSNICVKSIAEKLLKENVDFKLIVSKEFYIEWHEHLYTEIKQRLICTDKMPSDHTGMRKLINGSTVILSTLSMLSNPSLDDNGTFRIVPVQKLIVDDASQINVFEYMSVVHKFKESLVKVCFFGDPKQLPPFGKEKAKTLQSIFEVEHLKETSYFLDKQYRMPECLGNFISAQVYESKLKSSHKVKQHSCIRFVDTPHASEKKSGTSWTNQAEISTIVNLIRNYYRSKSSFCVITPYDAQRAAIQKQLKEDKLPWEEVYNVDSFQGNEADYVLISVVRSSNVGFLHSLERVNVMLTRCRKGMVVVSGKSFLAGVARHTLVGKLSAHWKAYEGENAWVSALDVMSSRVDLPGAPAAGLKRRLASKSEAPSGTPGVRTVKSVASTDLPTWTKSTSHYEPLLPAVEPAPQVGVALSNHDQKSPQRLISRVDPGNISSSATKSSFSSAITSASLSPSSRTTNAPAKAYYETQTWHGSKQDLSLAPTAVRYPVVPQLSETSDRREHREVHRGMFTAKHDTLEEHRFPPLPAVEPFPELRYSAPADRRNKIPGKSGTDITTGKLPSNFTSVESGWRSNHVVDGESHTDAGPETGTSWVSGLTTAGIFLGVWALWYWRK